MSCLMLILFLLSTGVTVSAEMDLQERIIGGQQCERPHHVRLRAAAARGSSSSCGGSLVGDRWILTAAHCLKPGRTVFAELVVHPGRPAQEVQITAEPVTYRDKDNDGTDRPHDLVLLQLPSPTDIKPIALPDCGCRPETNRSKVHISGHAATTGGPNNERRPGASSTLHCAEIEVVDCEKLRLNLQENFHQVYQVKGYQHWFCGQSPGMDICYGDSGGGVVFRDKIYGVISFLGDPRYVCTKAAAFMDLCHPEYAAWLNKTIA